MTSPRQQQKIEQFQLLVDEGDELTELVEIDDNGFGHIQAESLDRVKLVSWLTKTQQIIVTVFGEDSIQYQNLVEVMGYSNYIQHVNSLTEIVSITGVLQGCLGALEGGYVKGQEFLIAAEIFDSILEQATELNDKGYKDPAAVLARVALEDTLKRMARAEGIEDDQKTSAVNTDLWKSGIYPKAQWRQIQAWLDIGNDAAHGNFGNYSQEQVTNLINGVEAFIANQSGA